MSPHCPAIFLQHSRSADVIAAPGNTQAATGSAANITARVETPTLINSFNITSLSTADSKTQQVGKVSAYLRHANRAETSERERISYEIDKMRFVGSLRASFRGAGSL
jgi:hypothetical protein